jgi:hypothetical protein
MAVLLNAMPVLAPLPVKRDGASVVESAVVRAI